MASANRRWSVQDLLGIEAHLGAQTHDEKPQFANIARHRPIARNLEIAGISWLFDGLRSCA
jgi:hypothetical protein